MAETTSIEPAGLSVTLDKLMHQFVSEEATQGRRHLFVYFLTIHNGGDRTVTLLGRKWVMNAANGSIEVVEGDKIVGHTPTLKPGESFSYNSFHLAAEDCAVTGAFHGVDSRGNRIHVRIPNFNMRVPEEYRDSD